MDARIPVRFGALETATAATALLVEGKRMVPEGFAVARFELVPTGHVFGCACCLPRGAVGQALTRLFQARARGEVGFFREVLALPLGAAGEGAVRAALAEDVFVAARFRAG